MSFNRSRVAPILRLALASATLLMFWATMACGDSPAGPSSVTEVPTSSVAEVRDFSGLVELPAPTTMDLSLRIQRQSADATPLLLRFFATLFAQETTSAVSGTFSLGTVPPTGGTVVGTITSLSSLTAAGQFDGVFTEDGGSCTARQQYVGPITATGISLTAGNTLQQCPSASLAALSSIGLTSTGTVVEPAPDPGPDPVPGQVFTLTVLLAGSGGGTVTSSPAGIDCGSDCTEAYPEGTAVTLTPTSAAGSVFAGWSGDAECDGAVAMDADHSCTATFNTSVRPSFTLTVTLGGSGSGSVASNPGGIACGGDCTEDYAQGTVVTLTPTGATGSVFGGWTGHPDCSDGQVTMNAARRCTPAFDVSTAPTNTLTVTRAGTGSGTVRPVQVESPAVVIAAKTTRRVPR